MGRTKSGATMGVGEEIMQVNFMGKQHLIDQG